MISFGLPANCTCVELRKELAARGLPTSGLKAALMERLMTFDRNLIRGGDANKVAVMEEIASKKVTLAMVIVRNLFLLEAFVNFFSGPLMVAAPGMVMRDLLVGSESGLPPLSKEALEVSRWFGCMIFAFGSVHLYRSLHADPRTLRLTLESFLVGDVLYTGASTYWAVRMSIWTPAMIFNVVFSVILGMARVAALRDLTLAVSPEQRVLSPDHRLFGHRQFLLAPASAIDDDDGDGG